MMRRKLRKLLAVGIAWLPSNGLRLLAYRVSLGYRFGAGTRIGLGTVLCVDSFVCGKDSIISRRNRFVGPFGVRIGDRVFIGKANLFTCGDSVAEERFASFDYGRSIQIGDDALVNQDHIFDVIGSIIIGDGTWLAGFRSQFLTHGASVRDRDILIGPRCFIGSAVLVSPGSAIGPQTLVAMGSVVTRKFDDANVILGGVPARVLRDRSAEDEHHFQRVW